MFVPQLPTSIQPLARTLGSFLSRFTVAVTLGFGLIFAYVCIFHRISSLEQLQQVGELARQPLLDWRCRGMNETHARCLPNVFSIGASRCGTTSLVASLRKHPHISFVRRSRPTGVGSTSSAHSANILQSSDTSASTSASKSDSSSVVRNREPHSEVHRFDRNTYFYGSPRVELLQEWLASPPVPRVRRVRTSSANSGSTQSEPAQELSKGRSSSGAMHTHADHAVIHYTPHYLYAPSVPADLHALLALHEKQHRAALEGVYLSPEATQSAVRSGLELK